MGPGGSVTFLCKGSGLVFAAGLGPITIDLTPVILVVIRFERSRIIVIV